MLTCDTESKFKPASRSMKFKTLFLLGALAALVTPSLRAGEPAPEKNIAVVEDTYVGGRGLLTIQGPTGMFINPTSGTLPEGSFTAQYCLLLPNNETDIIGHGGLISYGVTEWLEIGGLLSFIDDNKNNDLTSAGGPQARVRILKDQGAMPEWSVGGYAIFGDLERYNAYTALYKNFVIDPSGMVRSIGLHLGLRETWIEDSADSQDAPVGYGGLEIELPFRLYLVGEVSTKDKDSGGDKTPYAFGVQWRLGGVNISTAFANSGAFSEPSFFFGVGSQF